MECHIKWGLKLIIILIIIILGGYKLYKYHRIKSKLFVNWTRKNFKKLYKLVDLQLKQNNEK